MEFWLEKIEISMFIFKLIITKAESRLQLQKDEAVQDERIWPESRDMGRKLFEAIEDILKKNNLKPEEVGDFQVESVLPEMYTSVRIAETVKKVYTFGVERLRKNWGKRETKNKMKFPQT